jgi:hypothetical protein
MSRDSISNEQAEDYGVNSYLGSAPAAVYMNLAHVTDDPEIQAKMPRITEALERLNEGLTDVMSEINWGMDPENPVQDGAAADRRAILALRMALGLEGEGESGEEMEIVD